MNGETYLAIRGLHGSEGCHHAPVVWEQAGVKVYNAQPGD